MESLGLYPSEMMDVREDREAWWLNLDLLPLQLSRKSGPRRKKKKEDQPQLLAIFPSEESKEKEWNQ